MNELALGTPNSSFSKSLPGLQIGVDSTSLGTFKTCPRLYFYSIVEGWRLREESVHLTFGILLHKAREWYEHAKTVDGLPHEEALQSTVQSLLEATWNAELSRPWISDHPNKNRLTLVRSAVWYLDQFGKNDPLQTVILANGKPAIELSFQLASEHYTVATGEEIILCGHMDRIATLNGDPYICDIKTTGSTIGPNFFKQFSPNNQMSLYSLAGRIVYQQPIRGIIIDGCQIAVTFTKIERQLVSRSDSQLEEWMGGLQRWLGQMEDCAVRYAAGAGEAAFPMNDKSCDMYGGCPFRPICSLPPGARDTWLKANYRRTVWDPLHARGDI